jgi:hypothetical protein
MTGMFLGSWTSICELRLDGTMTTIPVGTSSRELRLDGTMTTIPVGTSSRDAILIERSSTNQGSVWCFSVSFGTTKIGKVEILTPR